MSLRGRRIEQIAEYVSPLSLTQYFQFGPSGQVWVGLAAGSVDSPFTVLTLRQPPEALVLEQPRRHEVVDPSDLMRVGGIVFRPP